MNEQAAAAATIHGEFASPIQYVRAPPDDVPFTLSAVKTDEEADPFQGAGSTLRRISFEIQQSELEAPPEKSDILTELDESTLEPIEGRAWKVNEIRRRDDVGAWQLFVEKAPQ